MLFIACMVFVYMLCKCVLYICVKLYRLGEKYTKIYLRGGWKCIWVEENGELSEKNASDEIKKKFCIL